jgi:hypothetical protein
MEHMSYAKGITWIDDCRIPFIDDKDTWNNQVAQDIRGRTFIRVEKGNLDLIKNHNPQGRFPANLLVCDDMLNDGTTSKTNNGKRHNKTTQMFYGKGEHYYTGDKGTNSRYYNIDKWFDNLLDSCG